MSENPEMFSQYLYSLAIEVSTVCHQTITKGYNI